MLNQQDFKNIKNILDTGKEVIITCNSLERQIELEKLTYDFGGKLKIRNMKG